MRESNLFKLKGSKATESIGEWTQSKTIYGLYPEQICMEFAYSPCVYVGFFSSGYSFWVSSHVQNYAFDVIGDSSKFLN